MGRKRSRSRQPSAPPAMRRRRRPTSRSGLGRHRSPERSPLPPAAVRRTGPPPSNHHKEKGVQCNRLRDASGRKRPRSRSREPPAQPAAAGVLGPRRDGPSEPKIFRFAAPRTGRMRGQAVRRSPPVAQRPGTPPPTSEKRAAFRASPSPEPAEEEQEHAVATPLVERRRDGGGRELEKALYLILQERGPGIGVVSGYAVYRIGLAGSRHGVSVSGEELEEPPVARFKAAPGMAFFNFKAGSSNKVVGVTGRDAGVLEAGSVVIDADTWEVSTGPPPSSTEYGLVEVSGKIYAADMITEDPRCEVLRSVTAGWSSLPRPPFSDRILTLAAYPPRRGLLAETDKGETYLLDRRRRRRRRRGGSAWVALPGSAPLPFGERAVYAKDHGLWFEVSPTDGCLRAHGLNIVRGAGAPTLEHTSHLVSDPIPVKVIKQSARGGRTPGAKLVYLGGSSFCVVQAAGAERDGGCHVTVTVFRVTDSGMRAERRRGRQERRMNARWVAAVLERACAEKASASGRRRRKLCRVNLWSRTYVVVAAPAMARLLRGCFGCDAVSELNVWIWIIDQQNFVHALFGVNPLT